jgi:hypothetical protein
MGLLSVQYTVSDGTPNATNASHHRVKMNYRSNSHTRQDKGIIEAHMECIGLLVWFGSPPPPLRHMVYHHAQASSGARLPWSFSFYTAMADK